jgi:flavodoxin
MHMSKILVVYYSLDGNTELAANQIKDITGADLEQLIPEHEPVRKGFRKLAAGGFQALIHYKPRIKRLRHNLEDYETIVIASPVWAGTFLNKESFSGKQVVICACSASGKADRMIDRIRHFVGRDNTVSVTTSLVSPLKNPDKTRQKLEEFCLAWAE